MATDRKLISELQDWEIDHITTTYSVPKSKVKAAIRLVGRGRVKVYKLLKFVGYKNLPNNLK